MKHSIGVVLLLFLVGTAALLASDGAFTKPLTADLPTYPEKARLARVTGAVKLWFVLGADGEVIQAEVISGNPLLREAALHDVKSWKFSAGSMKPKFRYETEFVYKLDVQHKKGEPRLIVAMEDFRRIEVTTELYVESIE